MGIDSASVVGYQGLVSLTSPVEVDECQLINHYKGYPPDNCTWEGRDINILLDTLSHQSLLKDRTGNDGNDKFGRRYEDMKLWILAAFVLILVRRFVERKIFLHIGKRLGIKDRPYITVDKIPCRNPSAVPTLHNAYSSSKKLSDLQLQALSKETGLKQREIERWMRRRQKLDRPSTLVKFSESGWRFVTYIISTILGTVVLWDKPWLWDVQQWIQDYPNHELPDEMWWYYLYGGSIYISFLLTQFSDVKRKDFWEMLVHHVITVGLLSSCFTLNFTRMAMITLLLHDCADIFIESAKMANYAKKEDLATGIFIGFALVWIVTRLGIFPAKIIYEGTWVHGYKTNVVPSHIIYPLLGMLLTLFGLHLFWTYFICKVAVVAIKSESGKTKDSRSSNESSEPSSDSASEAQKESNGRLENFIQSRRQSKRFSLQGDPNTLSLLTRQRRIMKRISIEIM